MMYWAPVAPERPAAPLSLITLSRPLAGSPAVFIDQAIFLPSSVLFPGQLHPHHGNEHADGGTSARKH